MNTITTLAGTALAALAIATAAPAHAGPYADDGLYVEQTVCERLNADPRPAAIDYLGLDMMRHGLSTRESANLIVYGIHNYCPRYLPVLRVWLDTDS